jgi:hypothetical protein
MKKRIVISTLVLLLLACQFSTPKPTTEPGPPVAITAAMPTAAPPKAGQPSPAPTSAAPSQPSLVSGTNRPFAQVELSHWQPAAYAGKDYRLQLDLKQLGNQGVIASLTAEEQAFLAKNGFVVIHSQEAQFRDIRKEMVTTGQPYFLSTDAAFHALHITFDETLKALEREQLSSQMVAMLRAVLGELNAYLPQTKGTAIEADARLALGYTAVAIRLFDPEQASRLDPDLEALVTKQVNQVMTGGGFAPSVLIPGFEDDYGAYKPVGHYAGDPALENYFRGMTWLGRVSFPLANAKDPNFQPSRAPLIITLALRNARTADKSAAESWSQINEILTFLIGESDDPGPLQYSAIMDKVYGAQASLPDLAKDSLWQSFLQQANALPAPQISSVQTGSLNNMAAELGWRFMGQRFVLDASILQNLVYDKVGTPEKKRLLPSGLDVMDALGSPAAAQALEKAGETGYQNYAQQMSRLQQTIQNQTETQWLSRFYSGWLYAFIPQTAIKDASYPTFMSSQAWGYKDLNSALGSWAELKHDTALYTKMPEGRGGGGPPGSAPPPIYIEPAPDVFYRLAYIAQSVTDGLALRGIESGGITYSGEALSLDQLLTGIKGLAEDFKIYGDMAAKELAGIPFSDDDLENIAWTLGPLERAVEMTEEYGESGVSMPPSPVVAAVAGSGDQILEVAVGNVDRIYVVAPLEGTLEVAQGGVFSYYEFAQPRSDRLTDEEWRQRLASKPPASPAWASNFLFSGGKTRQVLAFRIGDVYKITPAGDDLNVRQSPSKKATVVSKLTRDMYITITDGPVKADGYTWWKIQYAMGGETLGWVVEQQDWYERANGQ